MDGPGGSNLELAMANFQVHGNKTRMYEAGRI